MQTEVRHTESLRRVIRTVAGFNYMCRFLLLGTLLLAGAGAAPALAQTMPGIVISESSLDIAEGGLATYTVQLASRPTGAVRIGLNVSDGTLLVTRLGSRRGAIVVSSLGFHDNNWDTPQTVAVESIDDQVAQGGTFRISVTHAVIEGDYSGADSEVLEVTITDNDALGVTVSKTTLDVAEAGGTATYTVVLDSQPTAPVTITPVNPAAGTATVSGGPLTFTAGNWNTPRTVTITGINDDLDNAGNSRDFTISHTVTSTDTRYSAFAVADVMVAVTDDEALGALGLTLDPANVGEAEGATEITVTARFGGSTFYSEATELSITVGADGDSATVASDDYAEVEPFTLTIAAGRLAGKAVFTFTPTEDFIQDPRETLTVRATVTSGAALAPAEALLTLGDNDTPGVTVSETALTVTEAGGMATYTVVLDSQPTAAVTITPVSSAPTVAGVSVPLVFTTSSWGIPRTMTVTGIDDDVAGGTRSATISHVITGGDYATVVAGSVPVTVTDDDVVGVTLSETAVTIAEADGTATYTVVLDSQPTAPVTLTPTSSAPATATVSGGPLTFTTGNWNQPRTLTITGIDDDLDNTGDVREASISHTLVSTDADYAAVAAPDLTARVSDDDTAGVTLSLTTLTLAEGGGTAAYTVVLDSQPAGPATITPTSSVPAAATVSGALTFTASNWHRLQTVTVTGVEDALQNPGGSRSVTITNAVGGYGGSAADVAVTVTDNDVQGMSANRNTLRITEGGTATYTLVLNAQPAGRVGPLLITGNPNIATALVLGGQFFTPDNWNRPQTVRVTAFNDDLDRPDRTTEIINFGSQTLSTILGPTITVTVVNNDTAGVTLSETALTVAENAGEGTYTVVLGSQPGGDVTLTPRSSAPATATVSGGPLTFTPDNWNTPRTVTVTGVNDDLDNTGDVRTARISHELTGAADYQSVRAGRVTVTITDDDLTGFRFSGPGPLTIAEGSSASYTLALASAPPEPVTVTLSSSEAALVRVQPLQLMFSAANWNTPQTVTLSVADDIFYNDGEARGAMITHRGTGAGYDAITADRQVVVEDDESPSMIESALQSGTQVVVLDGNLTFSVEEEGGARDFTLSAGLRGSASRVATVFRLVVGNDSDSAIEGRDYRSIANQVLTIPAGTTGAVSARFTVTPEDDDVDEDLESLSVRLILIEGEADFLRPEDANRVILLADRDTRGITVSTTRLALSEAGPLEGSYTVVLDSEPTDNMVINLESSNPSAIRVEPTPPMTPILFTRNNWDQPQTVRVIGVDDSTPGLRNREAVISHSPLGGDYSSVEVPPVMVTLLDDDGLAFLEADTMVLHEDSEQGASNTLVEIGLREQPAPGVRYRVQVGARPSGIRIFGGSFTFDSAQWRRPLSVRVIDDSAVNPGGSRTGFVQVQIRTIGGGNLINQIDVPFTVLDDDSRGVTSSKSIVLVDEGDSASYTLVLESQPVGGSVLIRMQSLNPDAVTVAPASMTFTRSNWNTPQTVTVTALEDDRDVFRLGDESVNAITHVVSGADYDRETLNDMPVRVDDNDLRGISASVPWLPLAEGARGTYTVVLDSQPASVVTLSPRQEFTYDDVISASSLRIAPPTLTFTPVDWNQPQTITVTSIGNDVDEVQQPQAVVLDVQSADSSYNELGVRELLSGTDRTLRGYVPIAVTNDDEAAVRVSESALNLFEGGMETYTLVLTSSPLPGTIVRVNVASGDTDTATVSPAFVDFTARNWNSPQTVRVTGVDDAMVNSGGPLRSASLTHQIFVSAAGQGSAGFGTLAVDPITVTVRDNDIRGVTVAPAMLILAEDGGEGIYTVVLNSQPGGSVTVTPTSRDTGLATVSPATLTFTTSNWNTPQRVTVGAAPAVSDERVGAGHLVNIEHAVSGYGTVATALAVMVRIMDNDVEGITLSETGLTVAEAGGTATYTAVLGSQPTGSVTITPVPDESGAVTISPATLTFTASNWNTPQTVTVTGVNDSMNNQGDRREVTLTHQVASNDDADAGYEALPLLRVEVRVTDDDAEPAGLLVAVSPQVIAEDAGATPVTLTVSVQGTSTYSQNTGLRWSVGGGSDTATPREDYDPVGGQTLLIPAGAMSASATFMFTPIDDALRETDETLRVRAAVIAGRAATPADRRLTITDDDMVGARLSVDRMTIAENAGEDTYTVRLQSQPAGSVTVTATSSDPAIATVSPATLTFTASNWARSQTFTVTGVDDNIQNQGGTRSATISHRVTGYGSVTLGPVAVTTTDDDLTVQRPVLTLSRSSITEGAGATEITATATIPGTVAYDMVTELALTASGGSATLEADYVAAFEVLTIAAGAMSGEARFTLTPRDDALDEDDETFIISAQVRRGVAAAPESLTFTLVDDDTRGLTLSKSALTVAEDEGTGTYTLKLESQPVDGDVTITLTNSAPTNVDVAPDRLIFTTVNWAEPQTVTVTGINDDIDNSGDGSRMATITHAVAGVDYDEETVGPVTVTLADDDQAGLIFNDGGLARALAENAVARPRLSSFGYELSLTSQPTTDVTISLSMSDPTALRASEPASLTLTFTPVNWAEPQDVVLIGIDNDLATGDRLVMVTHTVTGYAGYMEDPFSFAISMRDDETVGVSLTPNRLVISEFGGVASYEVALTSEPTEGEVVITLGFDNNELRVRPASLTFTAATWSTAQEVLVNAVDDNILNDEGEREARITHALSADAAEYSEVTVGDVVARLIDNEQPGVAVEPTLVRVAEAGSADDTRAQYTLSLSSAPSATVTITPVSSDPGTVTVAPPTLTFTTTNWSTPQEVTVTGLDDDAHNVQGRRVTITHTASGAAPYNNALTIDPVTVTVSDDEELGFTLSTEAVTIPEDGSPVSYTFMLDRAITGNFTVEITSLASDPVNLAVTSDAHTSLNLDRGRNRRTAVAINRARWNVPITVTLTPINDSFVNAGGERTAVITHALTPTVGNQIRRNVNVVVTDDDVAGLSLSPTTLAVPENDQRATYTVALTSAPPNRGQVTVSFESLDTGVARVVTTPAELIFSEDVRPLTAGGSTNAWNRPQTITIISVDDDIDNTGSERSTMIRHSTRSTLSDSPYNSLAPAGLPVTLTNDDTAAIAVSVDALTVAEDGEEGTYELTLATVPASDVTITLAIAGSTDATVEPTTVTFTSESWNTPREVAVTGVDDDRVNAGGSRSAAVSHTVTSVDALYETVTVDDLPLTITDNDAASVAVSEDALTVGEDGGEGTYELVLTSEPATDVTLTVTSSNTASATAAPATLTFTAANWNTPQEVTVTGVDDFLVNSGGSRAVTISHVVTTTDTDYGPVVIADLPVTATDNDTEGISFSKNLLTLDENGGTETYTVVLDVQPTGTVTITLQSNAVSAATVMPGTLTFTAANWSTPQTVTVTAVNDDLDNADDRRVAAIGHALAGFGALTVGGMVSINVSDDDTAGVSLNPGTQLEMNEAGSDSSQSYTLVLTSLPSGDVTVTPASRDVTVASVTTGVLTFTTANWATPQTVTVSGVDDRFDNTGNQRTTTIAHSVAGADYGEIRAPSVPVLVRDDDTEGVRLSRASLTLDEGNTGTYSVVLTSAPRGTVTVTPRIQDATIATVSTAADTGVLTFTVANWNLPQQVSVTGVDDDLVNVQNFREVVISHTRTSTGPDYQSAPVADVRIRVNNDDGGVAISESDLTVAEANGEATYNVVLTTVPLGTVTLTLFKRPIAGRERFTGDPNAASLSHTELVFTPENWNEPRVVTVTGVNDDVINRGGGRRFAIEHRFAVDGSLQIFNASSVFIMVPDDDGVRPLAPSLSITGNFVEPGDPVVLRVSVSIPEFPYDVDTRIRVTVSQPGDSATRDVDYRITSPSVLEQTLPAGTVGSLDTSLSFGLEPLDDDIDEDEGESIGVQVEVLSGEALAPAVQFVTLHDDDNRGIAISPPDLGRLEEDGGSGSYTVVLESEPTAPVTITLANSAPARARVLPATLDFTAADWDTPQTVTVTSLNDDLDNHDGLLTISHTPVGGDYTAVTAEDAMVTIVDDDTIAVVVSETEFLFAEDGGTGTYTVVLGSEPLDDVIITLTNSAELALNVRPTTLTFTATDWSTPQSVMLAGINDDQAVPGGVREALIRHTAVGGGYAPVLIDEVAVTVTDDETPGVILRAPSPFEVVEAGAAISYRLVLSSEPTGGSSVTIRPVSGDRSVARIAPTSLIFTTATWNTPQFVDVTGFNDGVDNPDDMRSVTISHTVTSMDSAYDAFAVEVQVTVEDIDTRAVTVTPSTLAFAEDGGTGVYEIVLESRPTGLVTVSPASADMTVATVRENSLIFDASNWSRPQEVNVSAVDDDLDNPDNRRSVAISHTVTGADYEGTPAPDVTITVSDDDGAPDGINLALSDTSVAEGTSVTVTVTATVDGDTTYGADTVLTLSVGAAGDAATVTDDYAAVTPFTLTIPAGMATAQATFTLTPVDDTTHEGEETLTLSTVVTSGPATAPAALTLTLADNDDPPTGITLSLRPDSVGEDDDDTEVTVTATVTGGTTYALPTELTVSVGAGSDSATADADYAAVADLTLTIPAGMSTGTQTFDLELMGDAVNEGDETIRVSAAVTGGTALARAITPAATDLTLVDNDVPGRLVLSLNPPSVGEAAGATAVTVTATVTGAITYATDTVLTVSVGTDGSTAAAANDYAAVAPLTLTIPAGAATAQITFTLTPMNDVIDEPDEVIMVSGVVTSGTATAPADVALTLTDDDAAPTGVTLSLSPDSIGEGDGRVQVTITVAVTGGTTYADAKMLNFSVGAGSDTAVVGSDYSTVTPFALTIPAGAATAQTTFNLVVTDDVIDEPDERLSIGATFSDGTAAPAPVPLTLVDNDTPGAISLSLSSARFGEQDDATTVTVTATVAGPSAYTQATELSLMLGGGTASVGADYTTVVPFTLTIPAGDLSAEAEFTLTPLDDVIDEPDETLTLSASVVSGPADAPGEVTLTLVDDDAAPTGVTLSLRPDGVGEEAGATSVTVTATVMGGTTYATASALTVSVGGGTATAGTDYTVVDDVTLTIAAGAATGTQTFTLTPLTDALNESDETLMVSAVVASGPAAAPAPVALTLIDDDVPGRLTLSLNPTSVDEDAGATPVTVTATVGGSTTYGTDTVLTVSVSSSDAIAGTDYVAVTPFPLTIPAGASTGTATFTLTPANNAISDGDKLLSISASVMSGTATAPGPVTLELTDDDTQGVTVTPLTRFVAEAGGTAAYTVVLDTRPANPVTVVPVSADAGAVTASPTSLTFDTRDWNRAQSVTVTGVDDLIDNLNDQRVLAISHQVTSTDDGYNLIPVAAVTVTVSDDDAAPTGVTLALNPTSVSEDAGATPVTVTATVGGGTTYGTDTVLTLSVGGGTATAGSDYAMIDDVTLTIPAGASTASATFTLTPINNLIDAPAKTLLVSTAVSSGTAAAPAPLTLTLIDDDAAPTGLTLGLSPASVSEGAGATPVTVTATVQGGTAYGAATVLSVSVGGGTASSGSDYAAVDDVPLTIPAGATSGTATFTLTPVDNFVDAPDKTLLVSAAVTSGSADAPADVTLTLADNDDASPGIILALDTTSVPEGADDPVTVTLTVTVDGGGTYPIAAALRVSVGLGGSTAASGRDYRAVDDFPLTLPANTRMVTATFDLTPVDDDFDESDETIEVTASAPGVMALAPAILTLADDDTAGVIVTVAGGTLTLDEKSETGTDEGTYRVALSSAPVSPVTVTPVTGDSDIAVVSAALVFTASNWDSQLPVVVSSIDDEVDNPGDVRTVTITNQVASTDPNYRAITADSVPVRVNDDDAAPDALTLTLSPARVPEGAGATDVTVTAMAGGGTTYGTDTVLMVSVGGGSSTATVNDDYVPVTTFPLTILAGEEMGEATFSLTPVNDLMDEPDETLAVSATVSSGPAGAPAAATLTLVDDDDAPTGLTLSLSPTQVGEGDNATSVTIRLRVEGGTTYATDTELMVRVGGGSSTARDDDDYSAFRSAFRLTIPAGDDAQSAEFFLTPVDDVIDERDEIIEVSATVSSGAATSPAPATLTLTDNDDAPTGLTLSLSQDDVGEEAGATDLTLTATVQGGTTYGAATVLSVSVGGGTASSGTDYAVVTPVTLTIAEGATSGTATFTFTPTDDALNEGDETLAVSATVSSGLAAAPAPVTLTLIDDDVPGRLLLSLSPASVGEEAGATDVIVTATVGGSATYPTDTVLIVSVGGGTASSGSDYTNVADVTLTIAAGTASGTASFTLTPLSDNISEGNETLEVSATISSGEAEEDPGAVTLTLTDDDAPPTGITLSLSPGSIGEGAGATDITVTATVGGGTTYGTDTVLTVSVSVGAGTASFGTDYAPVSAMTLTIAAGATSNTFDFTLTPTDDDVTEGDETLLLSATVSSGTASNPAPVTLTLTDNDTAGVTVSERTRTVTEAGATNTATYTLVLNTQPTAAITLTPTSSAAGIAMVSGALTFSTSNWNTPQTVTVTGIADQVDNPGDQRSATISHAVTGADAVYRAVDVADVAVTVTDDDTAGVTVSERTRTVTEAGATNTATYTLVLNTQPSAAVTLTPTSSAAGTATVSGALTFTTSNWNTPRTVTVTGVADQVDNPGDQRSATISHAVTGADAIYRAVAVADVAVTVTDDDTAGVTVSERTRTVAEAAGTATYTLVLNTRPTGPVILTPIAAAGTATVSGALTFTTSNWNTPQTVTITGVNDDLNNVGDQRSVTIRHLVTGADVIYRTVAVADVAVTVTDDDTPGVTVSERTRTVPEAAGTATYTLVLNTRPTGPVTLTPTSADASIATVSAALTFTASNWNTPRTVTITGVDDNLGNPDDRRSVTISHAVTSTDTDYSSLNVAPVAVTVTDDDMPGAIALSLNPVSVGEGADPVTVMVTARVEGTGAHAEATELNVSVGGGTSTATAGADYQMVAPFTLIVPAGATRATGQFTLTPLEDVIDDDEETLSVAALVTSGPAPGPQPVTLTLTDNDAPPTGLTLSLDQVSFAEDAGPTPITVTAAVTGGTTYSEATVLTLALGVAGDSASSADYGAVAPFTLTIPAAAASASATFTLTPRDDNISEGEETFSLRAAVRSGPASAPASVTLRLIDNDAPPTGVSLALNPAEVRENAGATPVTVTAIVAGGTTYSTAAVLTLTLGTAGDSATSADYEPVTPFTLTIPAAADSASAQFTFTPRDDNISEGEEILSVLAEVRSGPAPAPAPVMLRLTDNDAAPTGLRLSLNPDRVLEGAGATPVTVTATVTGGTTYNVATVLSLTLGASGDSARPDADYAALAPFTLTIPVGTATGRMEFTLTPVSNAIDEDDKTLSILAAVSAGLAPAPAPMRFTILDDDTAGVGLNPTALTLPEDGGTGTYTVALTSEPVEPVTVTVTSSDATAAIVSVTSLMFTAADWSTVQTVTVTAVDDDDANPGGARTVTVSHEAASDDANYAALVPVPLSVRVVDDDSLSERVLAPALVRFGRTLGEQSVEAITDRLNADRSPGVQGQLAGDALQPCLAGVEQVEQMAPDVTMGSLGAAPAACAAPVTPAAVGAAPDSMQSAWSGPYDDAQMTPERPGPDLAGSSFSLVSKPGETGATLALWSEINYTQFRGTNPDTTLEGDVISFMLGTDWQRDNRHFGVMLARSRADADYRLQGTGALGEGVVEMNMLALVPYAGLRLSETLQVWGTTGFGRGEVDLQPVGRVSGQAPIAWYMGAAGLEGALFTPPASGGFGLDLKADLLFTHTGIVSDAFDDAGRLAGADLGGQDTRRLRFSVEGRQERALALGGRRVIHTALGLRYDAGDAETGFGVEVEQGLEWQVPSRGLEVSFSGRALVVHDTGNFRNWGFGPAFAWDLNPGSPQGWSLLLSQEFGNPAGGGIDALFRPSVFPTLTETERSLQRWSLEAAHGFLLRWGGVGIPYTRLGGEGQGLLEQIRFGYRVEAEANQFRGLELNLDVWSGLGLDNQPGMSGGVEVQLQW